jgi:hypothetical protein
MGGWREGRRLASARLGSSRRGGGILATWSTTPHGTGPSTNALKAADEVAAALQAHLVEEYGAHPDRTVAHNPSTNSLKLLRQVRERLGEGLRAVQAATIAESDAISLRNQ